MGNEDSKVKMLRGLRLRLVIVGTIPRLATVPMSAFVDGSVQYSARWKYIHVSIIHLLF